MKSFCRILTIILTVAATVSAVYAAGCKLTATHDESSYQAGDTVSVTYQLEGLDGMDNDGIAAYQMTIYYDTELLMIKEIRPLGEISSSELSYNAGGGKAILIYVAGGGGADPVVGDPLPLCQVVFAVRSSAQPGKTGIRVGDTAFAGVDGTEIQSLQVQTSGLEIQIEDATQSDSNSGSNGGDQHNKTDRSEVETPIAMLDGEVVSVAPQSEPQYADPSGEERQGVLVQGDDPVLEQEHSAQPEVSQRTDQDGLSPEPSEGTEAQQPRGGTGDMAVWIAAGLIVVGVGVSIVLAFIQRRRKEQQKDEEETE